MRAEVKAAGLATALALLGLAALAVAVPEPLLPGLEMIPVGAISAARFEVTWQDWKRCHDEGGCSYLPPPGRVDRQIAFPVTGVNHLDVREFLGWLNRRTGKTYRLPTAGEWQSLGYKAPAAKKLFTDPRLAWAADYGSMQQVSAKVQPVGHFGASATGISDLSGNVWEWTSSCAMKGFDETTCPAFQVEGLHETALSIFVRDPMAGGCAVGVPPARIGVRLVEDL